jgi:hypothetical protein
VSRSVSGFHKSSVYKLFVSYYPLFTPDTLNALVEEVTHLKVKELYCKGKMNNGVVLDFAMRARPHCKRITIDSEENDTFNAVFQVSWEPYRTAGFSGSIGFNSTYHFSTSNQPYLESVAMWCKSSVLVPSALTFGLPTLHRRRRWSRSVMSRRVKSPSTDCVVAWPTSTPARTST